MIEAFIAIFLVAIIFTLYSFTIVEDDIKKKSERPIYIMLIVIIAWPVSLGLLVAPSTSTVTMTTTGVPLSCAFNSANSLAANYNATIGCGTTTQSSTIVTSINTPFPSWAFYLYMSWTSGITILFVVFLWRYFLEYSLQTFDEGLDSIDGKKRKR